MQVASTFTDVEQEMAQICGSPNRSRLSKGKVMKPGQKIAPKISKLKKKVSSGAIASAIVDHGN